MIKLTIYGRLRKFIGQSTFEIDVASARQAFSFLIHNFYGVADHIKKQEYCVMAGKVKITEDLLDLQTESDIKIIPVVHGEILPFIIGGGLISVGVKIGVSKFLGGFLVNLGLNLIIDGVEDLLTPPPTASNFKPDEQDPSFIFDGTMNISKQGVPINIVYGETLIGTNTVSANVDSAQVVNS